MEEKTDCQDAGGTLQPSNGSQVLYEKVLSCVDEKRIELTWILEASQFKEAVIFLLQM